MYCSGSSSAAVALVFLVITTYVTANADDDDDDLMLPQLCRLSATAAVVTIGSISCSQNRAEAGTDGGGASIQGLRIAPTGKLTFKHCSAKTSGGGRRLLAVMCLNYVPGHV